LKTQLLFCFVGLLLVPGFESFGAARNVATGINSVSAHSGNTALGTKTTTPGTRSKAISSNGGDSIKHGRNLNASGNLYPLLRLKVWIDQYNYDDIAIGFDSAATTVYNNQIDSRYLPGIDAPEGLSCFSADGVPLSVFMVPLPKQNPLVIKLDVEAQSNGPMTFLRTELDTIPKIYDLWLIDKFKKDSVNLRTDTSYAFTVDKSDTTTFGSNRFSVVIRQSPVKAMRLLDFNATKGTTGAQVTWTTRNEENYTHFNVERSSDGGTTFKVLDSIASTGAGNYSYADKTPPAASDEYRLKITDLNGGVTYSNAVTLIYSTTTNTIVGDISIYPNPTNNFITLAINQNDSGAPTNSTPFKSTALTSLAATTSTTVYNIKIVNTAGMVIRSASSATATWKDSVAKLSPGTYIVTVVNNSTSKLVGRSTFVKL
jgi:trimeric autotransporter adhesin